SSRSRHTGSLRDWSSGMCSSDLNTTWDGAGTLEITVGGSFTNASGRLFDAQGDGTIINDIGGAGSFSNAGTFRKSAGAGTLTIEIGRASCREEWRSAGGAGRWRM